MIDPISRFLQRQAGNHGPVMLVYHSVVPGKGTADWRYAISMQRFVAQLDFLASEGWTTVTMSELAKFPERYASGRTVGITFDDGFADNFPAFEELARRGMCASWFVVSGSLGRPPAWQSSGQPRERLLSGGELRQMRDAHMEIGSHTVSHVRLTEVDDARLTQELRDSKHTLEDVLGLEVPAFAYPHGAWNERCEEAVRLAGFRTACTTQTGWALRDGNPYRLRRLTVFSTDTPGNLARMLAFGTNEAAPLEIARYALNQFRNRFAINRNGARNSAGSNNTK